MVETIVCWLLQGNQHSRDSQVQHVVHPQYQFSCISLCCEAVTFRMTILQAVVAFVHANMLLAWTQGPRPDAHESSWCSRRRTEFRFACQASDLHKAVLVMRLSQPFLSTFCSYQCMGLSQDTLSRPCKKVASHQFTWSLRFFGGS